ncbi:hypothetical protein L6452_19239 [Arctium lappa]|uniref:Uncharacterized protein n=1 Tax=Arctium lappa TaxID=4217 RepID=A0ACB9B7B9_ARCLA|nr:hypothetical protein L6452_19239 [Arctium lappa]
MGGGWGLHVGRMGWGGGCVEVVGCDSYSGCGLVVCVVLWGGVGWGGMGIGGGMRWLVMIVVVGVDGVVGGGEVWVSGGIGDGVKVAGGVKWVVDNGFHREEKPEPEIQKHNGFGMRSNIREGLLGLRFTIGEGRLKSVVGMRC